MSSATTLVDLVPGKYKPFRNKKPVLQNWHEQGSARTQLKSNTKEVHFMKPYELGDPIKYLDWRAYARTEQLWIKEKFDPSVRKIVVLLDQSSSMHWPPEDFVQQNSTSKYSVGCNIALDILHRYLSLGDQVYLGFFDAGSSASMKRIKSLNEIHEIYIHKKFKNKNRSLTLQNPSFKKADEVVVISDALNPVGQLLAEYKNTKCKRFIHLLSQYEQDLGWTSSKHVYQDELDKEKQFKKKQLTGQDYSKVFADWKNSIESQAKDSSFSYISLFDSSKISLYHQLVFSSLERSDV